MTSYEKVSRKVSSMTTLYQLIERNMADNKRDSGSYSYESPLVKNVETDYYIDRFDRHKLVNGIPRHILLILSCIALCFAATLYMTYNYLTTYQAEAVVIFQEDRDAKPLFGNYTLSKVTLPTVLDIIKLPSNFQAVKSILGLDLDPKVIEGMVYIPVPRSESNLISITARADNPNLAIDIANALARVAVKSSQDFVQKQLSAVLDNFKNQLDGTRQKLSIQLREIEDFKKKYQYFEMTADYASLLTDVAQTRARLQEAELNYNRMLVEYENLRREVATMPDLIPLPTEAAVNPYQARIDNLETAINAAKERYSSNNPKLLALERELNVIKERAKSQTVGETHQMINNETKEKLEIELIRMQGKVRSAQKAKDSLKTRLAQYDQQLQGLPAQQVDFARLLSNKALTEERIRYLTEGLETLQLMINVPRGSLELYQIADKAKPYKDSIFVRLLPVLGLIAGSLLGIGLALLLEMRDKHIWTPRQVAINYSIPYWTTIPEFNLFNPSNGEDKTLYFTRSIAERLEKAFPNQRPHSVAITSSTSKEGKSALSYYLALYYHRVGKRVLLIEGDYRPNIFTQTLPFSALPLEEYLKGNYPPEYTIEHGEIDRIRLTQKTPYMKELIKSEKMRNLKETLAKEYDLIVIDAPGIIDDDYSANLVATAQVLLFLIGSKKIEKPLIDESLNELQTLGIIPAGILLNRVLSIYIEDQRIKMELRRNRHRWIKHWFFKENPVTERGEEP